MHQVRSIELRNDAAANQVIVVRMPSVVSVDRNGSAEREVRWTQIAPASEIPIAIRDDAPRVDVHFLAKKRHVPMAVPAFVT